MRQRGHSFVGVVAASAAALLAACSGPAVTLDLRFPSQVAFVASSLVDFDIVPLASSDEDLGRCPALLADAAAGTELGASFSQPDVPRCDVRRGLALPDPGTGAHAFIAQARSLSGAVVLVGCAVGEAYPGGPPIRIDLFPTDAYAAAASAVPPGSTPDGACP